MIYKTLKYRHIFVDTNLLSNGIYETIIPKLYEQETTIEMLVERAMSVRNFVGNAFIADQYFINLKLCELVEVQLVINKK